VVKALEAKCGGSIADCARHDDSRFAKPARNRAFYESTQTYGLAKVYKRRRRRRPTIPPGSRRQRFPPDPPCAGRCRGRPALEPGAVADEAFEAHRLAPLQAVPRYIGVERQRCVAIGDVRRVPWRAQPHAFRHVTPPERHRIAEHPCCDVVRLKMSRDRQAVRAGADHHHFAVAASGRPRNASQCRASLCIPS
jgi:hypothetical protein